MNRNVARRDRGWNTKLAFTKRKDIGRTNSTSQTDGTLELAIVRLVVMEIDAKIGNSCIGTTIKLSTNVIAIVSISRINSKSNSFDINQDRFVNCRSVGIKDSNCLR